MVFYVPLDSKVTAADVYSKVSFMGNVFYQGVVKNFQDKSGRKYAVVFDKADNANIEENVRAKNFASKFGGRVETMPHRGFPSKLHETLMSARLGHDNTNTRHGCTPVGKEVDSGSDLSDDE